MEISSSTEPTVADWWLVAAVVRASREDIVGGEGCASEARGCKWWLVTAVERDRWHPWLVVAQWWVVTALVDGVVDVVGGLVRGGVRSWSTAKRRWLVVGDGGDKTGIKWTSKDV
ncbi:hypothetical protein AKJ16_DCAP03413 [Drosera capensis]